MTSESGSSVSSKLVSALAELFEPKERMWPDEWGALTALTMRPPVFLGRVIRRSRHIRSPGFAPLPAACTSCACMICGFQMGKTDSEFDLVGERLARRPCPVLFVGLSKEFMQDQIEPRLMQMIAQSPSLADKLDRSRNKKTLKFINDVPVRLAHSSFERWCAEV